MAAAVAQCYNDVVAGAPYCEAVGGEWFFDLSRLSRSPLVREEILVARDCGEIVGFAHLGVAAPATEEWHVKGEPGVIRFLAYRRGERAVGARLLEAAERWLQERDCTWIVAEDCRYLYPFYHVPFAHISEKITHLTPLFGMAGYAVYESEVLFEWRDFEPPTLPRPDPGIEAVPEWRDQVATFGPGVVCYARQGEKTMGECQVARLGSKEQSPELADWCFCTSLYIADAYQGRGLGKWLLLLSLRAMREHGIRHAMVSTEWNNYRAYLLYSNYGFAFMDRTFSFRKELPDK
jgi:GNAT superfamily N-acetyltransferase